MNLKSRIIERLEQLKKSPRAASLDAGLGATFIRDILNGKSLTQRTDTIIKLARALETTAEWLLEQRGGAESLRCPMVGFVGAGSVIAYIPDDDELEYIIVPPGAGDVQAAAIVRGSAQMPVLRDGDTIFWGEPVADVSTLVGEECVCALSDGRSLLKTVLPGSKAGLYTLIAHNDLPMMDACVTSAAPVLWVKRRSIGAI